MKQLIFTVYDTKAHAYVPPFFLHTEGMAIRSFKDAANDPSHAFGKHPEDYTLFCLGTFNDASGHFDLKDKGQVIATALELVDIKSEPQLDLTEVFKTATGN